MKYIDSTVIVYALGYGDDPRSHRARFLLEEMVKGKYIGISSNLLISEVSWALWKLKGKDYALEQVNKLLSFSSMRFIPVSDRVVVRSLELMKKYSSLRPFDALHAATCIENGADTLISDDSDFDKISEIKRERLD